MSVAHSNTRVQFGTPIGRFQRVQDHIIRLLNAMDAARWATYEGALGYQFGAGWSPAAIWPDRPPATATLKRPTQHMRCMLA